MCSQELLLLGGSDELLLDWPDELLLKLDWPDELLLKLDWPELDLDESPLLAPDDPLLLDFDELPLDWADELEVELPDDEAANSISAAIDSGLGRYDCCLVLAFAGAEVEPSVPSGLFIW